MKDHWIKYSDRKCDINLNDYDHEDWLDYLGLFETSWISFAGKTMYYDKSFGWPGIEHE